MSDAIGEFEQLVLLALLRLGREAYGVTIRRELEARAERSVAIGAVYTTLDRLERKGYVAHRVGDPSPERGGRRKKFYTVRPLGVRALRRSLGALRRLTHGLGDELEVLR